MYPSFKANYGREPIAYVDYDPDADICQDDYEYYTGRGRYSDNVAPDADDIGIAVDLMATDLCGY